MEQEHEHKKRKVRKGYGHGWFNKNWFKLVIAVCLVMFTISIVFRVNHCGIYRNGGDNIKMMADHNHMDSNWECPNGEDCCL